MNAVAPPGNSRISDETRRAVKQKIILIAAVIALAAINAWALGLFTVS